MTIYRDTPHGPVIDLMATLKESLARVTAMQNAQEECRVFKQGDRVVYSPATIPDSEAWAERVGRLGTISSDQQADDWISASDRTVWVRMDYESESINVYTRNLKYIAPCSLCGADVSVDAFICPSCKGNPDAKFVPCEPCDGTGTIETSMYGGQYPGDVASCEDCDGHGLIAAPCLEDREAILAAIVKGDA